MPPQTREVKVRSATVLINVTIIDENDNAPTFTHVGPLSIAENQLEYTQLSEKLAAFDPDAGENGQMSSETGLSSRLFWPFSVLLPPYCRFYVRAVGRKRLAPVSLPLTRFHSPFISASPLPSFTSHSHASGQFGRPVTAVVPFSCGQARLWGMRAFFASSSPFTPSLTAQVAFFCNICCQCLFRLSSGESQTLILSLLFSSEPSPLFTPLTRPAGTHCQLKGLYDGAHLRIVALTLGTFVLNKSLQGVH
ncbi:unnamed protein product [Protopolystoma xenopodis]|uniref:Cadherin domain-containing protein n=1 Tax=Protopolystoma xenopodis TaxID=117903 RepID=A0A448XCI4_9PLAT|nr:unnamed protein product [Protopolystoma xenopodis]